MWLIITSLLCEKISNNICNIENFVSIQIAYTCRPRYLKVQGNGENILSYPKFDISKFDTARFTCNRMIDS